MIHPDSACAKQPKQKNNVLCLSPFYEQEFIKGNTGKSLPSMNSFSLCNNNATKLDRCDKVFNSMY